MIQSLSIASVWFIMTSPFAVQCAALMKDRESSSPKSICLGILTENFSDQLYVRLKECIEPYGGSCNSNNKFSRIVCPPNVIIPGDIAYRFKTLKTNASDQDISTFCNKLKQHAKSILNKCLDKIEADTKDMNDNSVNNYPPCVKEEEQGYLAIHVVIVPKKGVVYRPTHLFPNQSCGKRIRNRKRNYHTDSQGGDPRNNLEQRLIQQGVTIWTMNQALDPSSKLFSNRENNQYYVDILENENLPDNPLLDIHIAVWRRPFYLCGMYTKTRRDVSQTPFFVVDDGKKPRRLGITSVEEQITAVITKYCGGISTLNNDPNMTNVIYGMAKFHASGREDMDVRMILPSLLHHHKTQDQGSNNNNSMNSNNQSTITGRRFVYEIVDALILPSFASLKQIVNDVNHFSEDNDVPDSCSYGRNPMGVGISFDFGFVPASSFGKLQAETEEKVKHYGCLCWSENVLPKTNDDLMLKLGNFPLQIQQATPIRVLHRRSRLIRTRHVLTCRAERIDDHHFHLHISTDAGTYVKEFVHSDLGRTKPSIASLLGCRTDILQLDCEGIEL